MNKSRNRRIMQYVTAALAVLVALFITEMMARIDQKPTLFVFLGGVMVAAAAGGLWPGLLAVGMSAVLSAYYVLLPVKSFYIDGEGMLVRWLAFQLIGLLIVFLHASRRAVAEDLSVMDQRLRLAMDAGRIGVWDYSTETGELWTSHGIAYLFGQKPGWYKPTFDEFLQMIHSEDREFFRQTVLRTIADKVDYEADFRVVRPDGSIRSLVSRGRGYTAASSGGQRIVGVISENATNLSTAVPTTPAPRTPAADSLRV